MCSYCQKDSAGNHEWNCPLNPVNVNNNEWQLNQYTTTKYWFNNPINDSKQETSHYHLNWLEIAIKNFKNQNEKVHMIENNMTIGEFIKKYAKDELSKIIEV